MDWKAIAALIVGALIIIGTDTFKFWKKKKKPVRGGIVVGGYTKASFPMGKVFIAYVLSFIGINVLALISFGVLQMMISRDIYWVWSIIPFFGWLFVWGFIVNPILFPKGYLDYVDARETPPIGSLPCALSALFWLIAMLIPASAILSVE